jgi:hypothetical protein
MNFTSKQKQLCVCVCVFSLEQFQHDENLVLQHLKPKKLTINQKQRKLSGRHKSLKAEKTKWCIKAISLDLFRRSKIIYHLNWVPKHYIFI